MADTQQLVYRGFPLVRSGDEYYYGEMSNKFVIHLKVLSTKDEGGEKIPSNVSVEMLYTDPDIKGKNKIYKQSEKSSMSAAMELANAWLVRGK